MSFCVLRSSKAATAEEIIDFAARLIARYKRPKIVVFVDKLPKSATGDIDRSVVQSAYGKCSTKGITVKSTIDEEKRSFEPTCCSSLRTLSNDNERRCRCGGSAER